VRAPRRFPAAVVAEGEDDGAGEPDGPGVGGTDALEIGDGLGDGDALGAAVGAGVGKGPPNGLCGPLGPPPMTEQPPSMTAAARIKELKTR